MVARLALRKSRTYLPGVQWETLYGRLPWKLLQDRLGLEEGRNLSATGVSFNENPVNADPEAATTDSQYVPVDVERLTDGVKEIADFLIRQIQRPNGFRKLHREELSEFQIRAWLNKTVNRRLRECWRRNRPDENRFYQAARRVLKDHFVLLHDGARPLRASRNGFYMHGDNWWGLPEWRMDWPSPLSEGDILDRLASVNVVFPSRGNIRSRIHRLFLAYFEAARSPIREQVLMDAGKKSLGIADRDLPQSLDASVLRESDSQQVLTIEDRLERKNWQTEFRSPDLESEVKRLVASMTPRQREVARRTLAIKLRDEELKHGCEWDREIPTSTFYLLRNKFFADLRAFSEPEDFPIVLNVLEEELFRPS